MYQSQSTEIRTITSAHLAQTMSMLGMSSDEIREKIEGELANNPFLEIVEERICPICKRRLPESGKCPVCSAPVKNSGENVVFISPRDSYSMEYYGVGSEPYRDEPEFDSAQSDDLATYVLRQIAPDLAEDQKMVAAYLLNSLDEDGFITTDLFEVAQYYHISPAKIEKVIELIQHADPIGVGSRDCREALLVQIRFLSDRVNVPSHTEEVLDDSFEDLTHGHYKEVARAHGLSLRQVQNIGKFVGENLNPFPARAHWGETVGGKKAQDINAFHDPDILIYYQNDDPRNPLTVEVLSPISGFLQINPFFKKELKNAPEDKAEEWHNDFDKASLLIKSVSQRNNTIASLMRILVNKQAEYIRNGDEFIKPLTRAQVASDLGVHESTVSRAVSNKSVMMPNRKVVLLSSFFDRSLNVRTVLKDLIQNETTPLTDAKLVMMLQERGFNVARRTVAKYRLMEGIGSAHQRGVNTR